MSVVLIALYILSANGVIVPTVAYVFAWIMWGIIFTAKFIKFVLKQGGQNERNN